MTREIPSICDFSPHRRVLRFDMVRPSDIGAITKTVSLIVDFIAFTVRPSELWRIDLVLREALANAIVYGNGSSSDKYVRVGVGLLRDEGLLIVVKDKGAGFDSSRLPDPRREAYRLRPNGRGIFLITKLADAVHFRFNAGTELRILMHFGRAAANNSQKENSNGSPGKVPDEFREYEENPR